ncbi:MAG: glycolate oxidase subunit GlcF [Rhodospirillales bacterium]|jgi:glycolate oxidase iron-sulfur subunit|nr:glycolate oxidase subunit GlcF [Rhodospirillales bacterium]
MQTKFSPAQLADPHIETANGILRACVHCGFCTATCPSYVLLGDELDSPRGRIYLIKDMLENERPASAKLVKHVDRCLSCLSCMTTCPSGVHYMHLVDHARTRIAETYVRPWPERLLRALLAVVLPRPSLFRLALVGARLARPFKGLFPGRLKGLVAMAPASVPGPSALDRPQVFPAQGVPQRRVALLTGCAQRVLRPAINEATVRLLTRLGCEVVVAEGVGCCAALVHHMGREAETDAQVKANIAAFERVMEGGALDAIVVNASGCGTMVKDYGHVLRTEVAWAERARRVAALARDVSEVLVELDLGTLVTPDKPGIDGEPPVVAYHSACSLRHGQKITKEPKRLLADAGFEVREPAEAHLCCGSAGTYNLLQPELASALGARKADRLAATGAQVIATGNIGCLAQMTGAVGIPVVHTVELLDWATGGPRPPELG